MLELGAMTCLIIDTTGNHAYLAWAKQGVVVLQKTLLEGRQLSKLLLPSIHDLLQGQTPSLIAVGIGPGSFTGSRVGGIVAASLAYAWQIPLISFPSDLLPDLDNIAALTYQKFILNETVSHLELVYISASP